MVKKSEMKLSRESLFLSSNTRKNLKLNLVLVLVLVLKSKVLCCKVKLARCRAYHLLSWECSKLPEELPQVHSESGFKTMKEFHSWIWKPSVPYCSVDVPFSWKIVALENSWHFVTPPMVFPRNDDWVMTEEIPYWWRVNTQIWVVRPIGWNKFLLQRD